MVKKGYSYVAFSARRGIRTKTDPRQVPVRAPAFLKINIERARKTPAAHAEHAYLLFLLQHVIGANGIAVA